MGDFGKNTKQNDKSHIPFTFSADEKIFIEFTKARFCCIVYLEIFIIILYAIIQMKL